MIVLAVDTSHRVGSVALSVDGVAAGDVHLDDAGRMAAIGPAAAMLLAARGASFDAVDRVAVTIGPGSFTGLRVGLAWVRGLVAATGTELVAVGTLELLALPHAEAGARVAVAVDARRGEVYGAVFEGERDAPLPCAIVPPRAEAPEAFAARLDPPPDTLVGTALSAYPDAFAGVPAARRIDAPPAVYPSARVLAAVAARLEPLDTAAARTLEPRYLRESLARPRRLQDPRTR